MSCAGLRTCCLSSNIKLQGAIVTTTQQFYHNIVKRKYCHLVVNKLGLFYIRSVNVNAIMLMGFNNASILCSKENLKDKLRGIPIEVSVEILKPSTRRKRQTALPNLLPILDSSQGASTVTNVTTIFLTNKQ